MKRWKQNLIRYSITLVVMALALEVLLRLVGYRPYELPEFHVTTKPASPHEYNAELGYVLSPGDFQYECREGYRFSAQHTADGRRFSGSTPNGSESKVVALYGASFAYGFGVSDDSTFAALLNQDSLLHVKNYGVSGWSHAQMYVRMQQDFEQGKRPEIVLLAYAGFQDERGTMRRNWRKSLAPYNATEHFDTISFPVICNEEGPVEVEYRTAAYQPWPGQESSSLMHALENSWNYLDDFFFNSHLTARNVVLNMHELCEANGSKLVVLGMDTDQYTQKMLKYCEFKGIEAIDIGVDVADQQWNLQPYDHHPNALAHQHYANGIRAYLSSN